MINSSLTPEDLVAAFTRVNEKTTQMNKYSTEDLLELSTKLKEYQQRIDEFVADHDNEENRKKLQAFHLKISQIIVDLQFNDIIRQKLEHLEEIHQELISELNSGKDEGTHAQITIGIARLTKAQLEYIDNEYKSATDNIKNQLMAFWQDKIIAGTIELGFLDILNNADVFSKQVKMAIMDLTKVIDSQTDFKAFREEEYAMIQSRYTMQSEREVFGELFGVSIEEEEEEIELF